MFVLRVMQGLPTASASRFYLIDDRGAQSYAEPLQCHFRKGTWFLVDTNQYLHQTPPRLIEQYRRVRIILASAQAPSKWAEWVKQTNEAVKFIVMQVWTREEVDHMTYATSYISVLQCWWLSVSYVTSTKRGKSGPLKYSTNGVHLVDFVTIWVRKLSN